MHFFREISPECIHNASDRNFLDGRVVLHQFHVYLKSFRERSGSLQKRVLFYSSIPLKQTVLNFAKANDGWRFPSPYSGNCLSNFLFLGPETPFIPVIRAIWRKRFVGCNRIVHPVKQVFNIIENHSESAGSVRIEFAGNVNSVVSWAKLRRGLNTSKYSAFFTQLI